MRPQKTLSSSVGSKFLIAFTELSLLLFLVAHLGGNLLFLLGPDAFDPGINCGAVGGEHDRL